MTEPTELLPCPFCGAGESQIHVNKGTWNGRGYGEPVSVEVRHWCADVPGQPSRMISRAGRDEASAITAWNTRTTPQPTQAQAGAVPQCWCLTCRPIRLKDPYSMRMALCPTCGNKRCPKANDHRNECTGSNEPGQPGSAYSGGIKGGQHGAE